MKRVRIRLRHAELDGFVERFAPNVTRGGVFLATRHPHPEGTPIAFEIQLATGHVALAGEGTVTWVREWNPAEPGRPHGMGVRFSSIDAESKPTLARLLKVRGAAAAASGPLAPKQTTGPVPAGPSGHDPGRSAATLDTTMDLASEMGIDPGVVRSLIDRTFMTTNARLDEDLSELLRPEPLEAPVSLAQALGDLPRFLDSATARRRTSSVFRTVEGPGSDRHVVGTAQPPVSPRTQPTPSPAGVPSPREDDITDMTVVVEGGRDDDDPGEHAAQPDRRKGMAASDPSVAPTSAKAHL